jgi:hypothetical protein
MNQTSDEHHDASASTAHQFDAPQPETLHAGTAERAPTELQRAMQQRAQESLERSRERAKTKPAPLKWAVMFVLALVPVLLLVAGIDAFVRVFHQINDYYSKLPVPAPEPAPTVHEPVEQRPGIIMLESPPTEDAQSKPEAESSTATEPPQ